MAIMEATQDKGLVSAGYNKQIQLNTRMIKKSEKNKYRDLIRNGGIATAEMPVSVFEKRVKAKAESCENLDKNRTNMKNSLSARKADWDAKKSNVPQIAEEVTAAHTAYMAAHERHEASKVPHHICLVERENSMAGTCDQHWDHKLLLKSRTCNQLKNIGNSDSDFNNWQTCNLELQRLERDTVLKRSEYQESQVRASSHRTLAERHDSLRHREVLLHNNARTSALRSTTIDTCA
jgi:hypothetical protein